MNDLYKNTGIKQNVVEEIIQLAEKYCVENEHIKKIYSDSELEEDSTFRNFRIVQTEGSRQVTRNTKHYNLQMIIAVGFYEETERRKYTWLRVQAAS